jgi:hypothetical protein
MNFDRLESTLSRLPIRDYSTQRIIPFRFTPSQRRVHSTLRAQHSAHRPMRVIILKSRRQGISTYSDALLTLHCCSRAGTAGHIITHDFKSSKALFKVPRGILTDSLPGARPLASTLGLPAITQHRILFPHREGDSELVIATAGNVEGGRGMSLTDIHLCLGPDSLIMSDDGNLVPISSIRVGDRVWTHNGIPSTVRAISNRAPDGRRTVSIKTWLNFRGLTLTADHKIFTQRGWVEAGKLTTSDWIGTAKRKRSYSIEQFTLPELRDSWGRLKGGKSLEMAFPLNRETGFFAGYYLAEGSIHRSSEKKACSIIFTHHEKEGPFASRAVSAVSNLISSARCHPVRGTKSSQTSVQGSSLARFMEREFGYTSQKRIPDWVFDAKSDGFLLGLIEGYLCGDGSKEVDSKSGYECPTIYVTSIRPRLLYQLRNVLAIFGGWGGMTFRRGFTDSRGWKCADAWTLSISGTFSIFLRETMGWATPKSGKLSCRRRAQKYLVDDDHVWTKVRSVSPSSLDSIWDIEVDHPDHSFETVIGAVANSEMAMYPSEGTFAALLPTVPRSPDTIILIESTAKGKTGIGEPFYQFWQDSVAGQTDFAAIFLSWLEDPHCINHDHDVSDAPIDEEERLLMHEGVLCNGVLVKATLPQIAWRRMQIASPACRGVVEIFDQEYPRTPDVAFTSTELPAFTSQEMLRARNGVSDPSYYGRISLDESRRHVFWTDDTERSNSVVLWEKPQPGARYYFGIDAARGKDGMDFSAVVGVNGETGDQCLRWEAYCEPEALALFCYAAGLYFNKAMLCIELTGNLGYWVQTRLRNYFTYPNIYKWRGTRDDKVRFGKPATYGWETTYRSRENLMTVYRESIANAMFTVRDSLVLQQMEKASRRDPWERWEITRGHDDVLFAAMLANMSRYQWHVPRSGSGGHVTTDADQDSRALAKLNPQTSFETLGTVTADTYRQVLRDRDKWDRMNGLTPTSPALPKGAIR